MLERSKTCPSLEKTIRSSLPVELREAYERKLKALVSLDRWSRTVPGQTYGEAVLQLNL